MEQAPHNAQERSAKQKLATSGSFSKHDDRAKHCGLKGRFVNNYFRGLRAGKRVRGEEMFSRSDQPQPRS